MSVVPEILYKYRPILEDDRSGAGKCFTKNLLLHGELYFSRFSELNDPNEAIFDYCSDVDIAVDEDVLNEYAYFSEKEQLPDGRFRLKVNGRTGAMHVRKQIDKMYGLLCLTEKPDNLLMYDYYAGGHKGICVGFDWKKLGLIVIATQEHQIPQKIKYCSKPPFVSLNGARNFAEIFFTKCKNYRHEKELRLQYCPGIYKNSKKVLSAIREIIFGCATSQSDRAMVMEWTSSLDVSYYEAHLSPRTYNLHVRAL